MVQNKYIFIAVIFSLLFVGCTTVVYEEKSTGYQNNAWDNQATGLDGFSGAVDTRDTAHISIMVSTAGATDLSVYVSQDNITYVLCEALSTKIRQPVGNQAHLFFTAGARYYKLRSSNNVIANATISGK